MDTGLGPLPPVRDRSEYARRVARRNGEPGRTGIVIAAIGLCILLAGVFIGAELNGLNLFGFLLVLGGTLTTLFGVLREVSDRTR
jgi:hypothetical protein